MSQPDYTHSTEKIAARAWNIEMYRKIIGDKIPEDRSYWTLCNEQPIDDGSEICQLVNSGLITKSQFHGVDRDWDIIDRNRIRHPEANWYAGEWKKVIRKEHSFNPSFIYLDTTSFADEHVLLKLVYITMMACQPDTLLFVNGMLNDPRSRRRFIYNKLIENLGDVLPEIEYKKWNYEIPNYNYCATGKTKMRTYTFHKRK